MRSTLSQDCPLCAADAVYYFVDYEERKYFKCPGCGKFLITRRAESRLSEAPSKWNEQLSQRAKSTPENLVLDISIGFQKEDGSGRTAEEFKAEYVPKSDLRL